MVWGQATVRCKSLKEMVISLKTEIACVGSVFLVETEQS